MTAAFRFVGANNYSPLHATRTIFIAAFISVMAASSAFSQVRVDDKADQVAALQIELEQARQNRDRILARRWEDKQRDTEAREKFNREYDEIKNRLELKIQEADRLHAEIQNHLRDAEEAQARAEEERIRFLSLSSALRDKARDLAPALERSFPTRVPERIAALNKVLKGADMKREAPGEILAELMDFQRGELNLSREISAERRGFIRAGQEPGEGLFLRLGTVTAAYRDEATGAAGLLLKNPPDRSIAPFDWKETLPPPAADALAKAMTVLEKESGNTILIPMDVLLTQNLAKTYTQASDKGFWRSFYESVLTGGVFMIPLVLVLFIAVVLFTRKHLQLRRARRGMDRQEGAVAQAERGNAEGVHGLRKEHPENLVFRTLDVILMRREAGRVQSEKAVRELLMREVPKLERGLTTLAVLAAAAPMLGLLGTISGLIAMFQVITELGVNDPKMLAGGIGEALITTEAGLIIAIPVLLAHNFLANRVDDMVADAEYHAARTLNALWPQG
jgi:biopolymer transport protein ExbB